MHLHRKPRRRLGWAALAALCLTSLLAVAGLAWADGEDDPTFGGAGTVYVPAHEGTGIITPPVVDQAPDGTIVSAVGVRAFLSRREAIGSFDSIQYARYSATGEVLENETEPTLPFTDDFQGNGTVFDVEAMADGTIVIAHAAFPPDDTCFDCGRRSNVEAPLLVIVTIAPNGDVDVDDFEAPGDCQASGRRVIAGYPKPGDADVAPDGSVYAVWNDCTSNEPVLAHYVDGALDADEFLGDSGRGEEIVAAPSGDVFLATAGEYQEDEGSRRANFPSGLALVTKHDPDTLARDTDYGNDGAVGAILPDFPLDLTVDPQNRAVVWGKTTFDRRGVPSVPVRLYRLDPGGDLDTTWGDEGTANLQNPLFGDPEAGSFQDPAHLIAQADSKIVIVGPTPESDKRGELQDLPDYFVARATAGGALDPTWDGDGVRPFDTDETKKAFLFYVGEPALQGDGKLLVPTGAANEPEEEPVPRRRIPDPPENFGGSLGVSRLNLTPAPVEQPAQPQQPVTPASPAAPTVAVASSKVTPSCKSRRSFQIRLRTGRTKKEQSAIKSAVVKVNGKRVKVTATDRQRSVVNLKNLPKGRFTVDIRLVLADGGKVKDIRRYRTCTKKIERELAPLRTHPPGR